MFKKFLKKLIYREKFDSKSYISYLRKKGVRIGERCMFFAPTKTCIDVTRPWLVEIGDDVQITEGVTVLTHGYDWAVLKNVYGEVLGSSGKVKIGNNVFVGMHSTILKGVCIGDNVIIGANSVVSKDIPANSVVVGNPARVIMSLEDYYKKRKQAQDKEAQELVKEFREVYKKEVGEWELREFFWLFEKEEDNLLPAWKHVMSLAGNSEQSYEKFRMHEKKYESKEKFLENIK